MTPDEWKPPQNGVATDPLLAHLHTHAAALQREIKQCLLQPEEEAVHRLRTGTRRVEAQLETIARTQASLRPAARATLGPPIAEWLKQLKKVRRAAGAVRDLDVHRKIVSRYLRPKEQAQSPAPSRASLTALHLQAEELDQWLKSERESGEAQLAEQLSSRAPLLLRAEEAFASALASAGASLSSRHGDPAVLALHDFIRIADEMPTLHEDNLHDYRKATKKARYVAEAGGDAPDARAVSEALKRVQDAIGDWHDWSVLAAEARAAVGSGESALVERIDCEVAKQFVCAIRAAERGREELTGEWLSRRAPRARRARQSSGEDLRSVLRLPRQRQSA